MDDQRLDAPAAGDDAEEPVTTPEEGGSHVAPSGDGTGASAADVTADVTAAAEAAADDIDDLASLAAQRDEYLDALLHLQADFENYKKRVAKQQADQLERAAEGLVEKLLPVLDTVDLARAHGGGEGADQIGSALVDVLAKEGLERVGEPEAPFDPKQHDAVLHEDGDGEPVIVEVMRAGYRWRGRLLRPAMVKVKGS